MPYNKNYQDIPLLLGYQYNLEFGKNSRVSHLCNKTDFPALIPSLAIALQN